MDHGARSNATSELDLNGIRPQQLISDEMLGSLLLPIRVLTASVSVFGFTSNVANVLVYFKMGLRTSSNICFFSLAIADFISVGWIFLLMIHYYDKNWGSRWPALFEVVVAAVLPQVAYAASAFGSWVTTLITLERCCCVVFPLKVKAIFTTRIVVILTLFMVTYEVATSTPYYFAFAIVRITLPGSNVTQVTINRAYDNMGLIRLVRLLSFSLPTVICFILVFLGTLFLIRSLKKSKKLREAMTNNKSDEGTTREARVVKSVIFVCVIYMLGYFINVFKIIAAPAYPKLHPFDPYMGNFTVLLSTVSFTFQAISCSVNILVYLRMNSQFKETFVNLFKILNPQIQKKV